MAHSHEDPCENPSQIRVKVLVSKLVGARPRSLLLEKGSRRLQISKFHPGLGQLPNRPGLEMLPTNRPFEMENVLEQLLRFCEPPLVQLRPGLPEQRIERPGHFWDLALHLGCVIMTGGGQQFAC